MNAIQTYLDNVFAAFPQTSRVQALKAEMQAGMEEKYHELKAQGKSEHEAVGSVIANFGSMDEITAELGLAQNRTRNDYYDEDDDHEDNLTVTRDEAFEYVGLMKKSGRWIGAGVWLILTGVAGLVLINNFTLSVVESNAIGVLVLMAFIAAAVALFVINGTRMARYEAYEESRILLDPQTRTDLEQQSARFMSRYAAMIASGIAAILLAVGLYVLLSQLTALTYITSVPLLLCIVGGAVFLFVNASSQHSAYENLLGRGEYEYTAKMQTQKSDRIIGTVAAIFWPAAVAVYLLWSFVGNAWHISWVIWPVAGVLFGAFAGGISVWHEG